MGIFSRVKITNKHVEHINSYLPQEIHEKSFKMNELKGLQFKIKHYVDRVEKDLAKKVKILRKLREERLFNKYKLFNVSIKGKSLGMVDIGIVERFSSKSSGNSYENGIIQHAIESSFEEMWAKNNSQYNSVNRVKNLLIDKALELYPESNAIENFKINFRELGSSGNVFLYANGTATISDSLDSIQIDEEIKNLIQEVKRLSSNLNDGKDKLKSLPSEKVIKTRLKELK